MRKKIFWNCLLAGLLSMVLCCALMVAAFYRSYESEAFGQLAVETRYIAHGISLNGEEYLATLEAEERITWVNPDGSIRYDSHANANEMDNHLDRQEIAQAMAHGWGQSSRYSATVLERHLYYALRLEDGSVLRVSHTQGTAVSMLLMVVWPMLAIIAAVGAVCALLAFRLAHVIVTPINRIDLDRPGIGASWPEITPLVERIREQNRTIRQQMDELSQRQREFTAITENMTEGFLLVDSRTNILSGNSGAFRFLRGDRGARVENLIRDCAIPSLNEAVQAALAGERAARVEEREGRSWQIVANPVVAHGQVVGVAVQLVDVTEREQREQLRREFSANVSHELKTPLTSISGFAELMRAGIVPMEKVKEFSDDIYRQSQRLIGLVEDIIRLSKLEDGGELYQRETVNLTELGEDVVSILRPVARNQSVTLTMEGDCPAVNGVWQIIHEMVYNLCDNAIKYNRPGGTVTLRLHTREGRSAVTVSDTGIGIPYADQDRVFERFYRVDKSHSKEVGGTGLGLSIVKHGAQYHDAQLELKSTPGEGTDITIIF